jgi:N-acetylglucosaminyl-diphospho-decaprenol L-rhamnosyltransferase
MRDDLAVIVVSTNEAHWLRPCLTSVLDRKGDLKLDVVVADNESTDGTSELIEREFPEVRVVPSKNRGFSHANNRAFLATDARYVLFLNPDTEILDGSLDELVAAMDKRPTVGLAGVQQVSANGRLYPTIGRFPNAVRALSDVFGLERLVTRAAWLGSRELNMARYDQEIDCDWTSGSFMLARREALDSAGLLDERFFIYAEEVDLCYRIKEAGWDIRHLPMMRILHHAEKAGINPRMEAQLAYAARQYARKHFSPVHRAGYFALLTFRYLLRSIIGGRDRAHARDKRAASRRALVTLVGLAPPPFGVPPRQAVAARAETPESLTGRADVPRRP